MMVPASVHLPIANSAQEDLEIFRGVEAALSNQAAQTAGDLGYGGRFDSASVFSECIYSSAVCWFAGFGV